MELPNYQDKVEEVKPLTPSPPSTSSSPTHEFSFTTSIHHHSNPHPLPFTAVDLSPAGEIFFHGHLLPLHLLSHLASISPRSSTNSLDSFTLPMHQLLLQDQSNPHEQHHNANFINQPKGHRPNYNSFSLFGFLKWRKRCEIKQGQDQEKEHKKKLLKFDLNNVLKRYTKMVRPFFRGSRNRQFRGKRGEFSAPVSTTTSPTNSGLLVATGMALASCNGDSSMEEFQAAIQAAIAHCKNSLTVEDKTKK